MFKKLYSWHIGRRSMRLTKDSIFLNKQKKFSLFKKNPKPVFLAGHGQFSNEKPVRRHIYRHILLVATAATAIIWFLAESISAWNLFQL